MSDPLNRVEISRAALVHNFRLCRKKAGNRNVLAMIKADGYGHGMLECARLFAGEGAAAIGVAEVVDGIKLRNDGFTGPLLLFAGVMPEVLPVLIQYNLTPILMDQLVLEELSRQVEINDCPLDVHVKVDVGMGRQGCSQDELPPIIKQVLSQKKLRLRGVMAHFPMADNRDSESTPAILAKFQETLDGMRQNLPDDCCLHVANSGAIFNFPQAHLDMVRPGISLYGYYADGELGRRYAGKEVLKPAMRFVTKVIQVRNIASGVGLGYGHTFVTRKKTKVAVLPVGYADGYLRSIAGKGYVLIAGQPCAVLGRISMNLTLVDVSHVFVERGDEAVLLGSQGKEIITADDVASWMNTISYEVLCLFGNLNNRVYLDDYFVA